MCATAARTTPVNYGVCVTSHTAMAPRWPMLGMKSMDFGR